MNMIPFVTIFLLIFALLSTRFATQAQHTTIEQITHRGYLQAERETRSESEIKAFEAFKRAHRKKSTSQQVAHKKPRQNRQKKEPSAYSSFRYAMPASEGGKIDLYPLFQKEPQPELEKIAQSLWLTLYSSKYEKERLKKVFKAVLDKGRERVKEAEDKNYKLSFLSLTDLYPDEERELYYRLLRGTQRVDLQNGIGIPSLEHFFKISVSSKAGKKPISFSHASSPLLVSLFGSSFTQKIIEKEQSIWESEEKKRALKESELDELAMEEALISQKLAKIKELIRFESSSTIGNDSVQAVDNATGITASRKLVR